MTFQFGIKQGEFFSKEVVDKVNQFRILDIGGLLGLDINDNHQTICINNEHNDSNPSMTFFDDKAYCFGCGVTYNPINLVMDINNCVFSDAIRWLLKNEDKLFVYKKPVKEKVKDNSELSPMLIKVFRNNLTDADWDYLQNVRGLTKETIDRFMIGRNKNRLTIPIYENGSLANFRMYNAESENKIINFKSGCGIYLYGEENLIKYNKIVVSEGEFDRHILEQVGIPAVTSTGGAGSFKKEWLYLFAGKEVSILFDRDLAGDNGSEKIYNYLKETAIVNIVLIQDEFPEGYDITDLYLDGWREKEFKELIYG